MKRALLEIIAAGVASTRADVEKYAECTYLNTCLAAKQGFDATNSIKNTMFESHGFGYKFEKL